jgi:ABC-type nitrate/sulfonate/bicarbonate transport system substrate-binding protein
MKQGQRAAVLLFGPKHPTLLILLLTFWVLPLSLPRTALALEEVKLHIAGGVTPGVMIYKLSKEKGFYKDEGLELLPISTGLVQGIQGLIAGSFDFSQILGQGASAIVRGAPLKIVMVFDNRPLWWIYGAKNLKSMTELRGGKQVATATFGSAVDQMTRELFPKYGIEPGRDVILRPVEPPANRLTALMNGVVDAGILTLMEHSIAKNTGLNELFFYGDHFEFVTAGVVVADQTLSQRPDFVRRFLRATLRGFYWWKSNEKEIVKEISKSLKRSDGDSTLVYNTAVRAFTPNGAIHETLQNRMIAFQKRALKVERDIRPEDVYDFGIVNSLNREGIQSGG